MRASGKFTAYVLFMLLLLNPVVSPLVAAFSFFSASNATVKQLYKNNKKRKNKIFNVSKTSKAEQKHKEKKQKSLEFEYIRILYTERASAIALHTVVFNRFLYSFTAKLFILQCKLII